MKNCLVKKLNFEINNNNLDVFGAYSIVVPPCDYATFYNRIGPDDRKLILEGGGHFEINGVSYGNVLNNDDIPRISSTPVKIVDITSSNVLRVFNKYTTGEIALECWNGTNPGIEEYDVFGRLEYCTELEYFGLRKYPIPCRLKKLNLSKLTTIDISYSKTFGDISLLANLTNLSRLQAHVSELTGTIEEFVARQRGYGRTTGTINTVTGTNYGKVTFNNEIATGNISWTETQITCGDVTIDNNNVISPD